jgi:predicted nucleic acid-binding protein
MTPVTCYFDSSALVKRYMREAGTTWVQGWCDDPTQVVAVAEIGLVEMAAAFAGKMRGGFITAAMSSDARADLLEDARSEYVLVAIDRSIVDDAIDLTVRQRLRGYEAVHLACALRLNQALITRHLPPLLFVSADSHLLAAAIAEGLATDDPNLHP